MSDMNPILRKPYDEREKLALDALRGTKRGGLSRIAREYGISKSTLWDRARGRGTKSQRRGFTTKLSREQEGAVIEFCRAQMQLGDSEGLPGGLAALKKAADAELEKGYNGTGDPPTVGINWPRRFAQRFPELRLVPTKTVDIEKLAARAARKAARPTPEGLREAAVAARAQANEAARLAEKAQQLAEQQAREAAWLSREAKKAEDEAVLKETQAALGVQRVQDEQEQAQKKQEKEDQKAKSREGQKYAQLLSQDMEVEENEVNAEDQQQSSPAPLSSPQSRRQSQRTTTKKTRSQAAAEL